MASVRENKGFHPTLDDDHGHIFIDSCMQAWPDADWPVANEHGVTTYSVTAWRPYADVEEALEQMMYWRLVTREHDSVDLIETADDIVAADEAGRASLLVASQDGSFIDDKLHRIEAFYELGLRMMIPTYNRINGICGGCNDASDPGLTLFGERVVEESNRVGLLLDCTHLGKQSSMDIMEHSDDPVVFSHSNAKEVVDCYRNIDDEQILACAESGGVIGLAPFGPFTRKPGQTEWPTLEDFIDHIDHVVDITGSTKHVGIGTDMSLGTYPDHEDHPWGEPDYISSEHTDKYAEYITGDVRSPRRALQDFNDFTQVTNLIDALDEHGYSESDISNFLGENYLRVFDEVWS